MLPNLAKYTYGYDHHLSNITKLKKKKPWVAIDGTLTRGHLKKLNYIFSNFLIWKVWQKFQKIAKLVKFTLKKIKISQKAFLPISFVQNTTKFVSIEII
jgi:hypothetical protein